MGEKKIVLVTGGTGLVGSAIREVIEAEKPADEEWVYASSKVRPTPAVQSTGAHGKRFIHATDYHLATFHVTTDASAYVGC